MNPEVTGNSSNAFGKRSLNLVAQGSISALEAKLHHLFSELNSAVRDDLISYLEGMGLVTEPALLVIPSSRHYFYSAEDLNGVKTVVNLKQLNYVREIREFLRKVSEIMPQESSFVGCFIDNRSQTGFADKYSNLPRGLSKRAEAYENGIDSRIPFINRMYSFIDLKTNRYLTKKTVTTLLRESNLELLGMTEVNGLTYFHSKKRKAQIGLIA
ncbi:MAG: hypothetical protein RBT02_01520 [Bacteroidales bacterium]|jgi:hypothetical protein|nr:hypothetical protein [Bacteroidales bacterium]